MNSLFNISPIDGRYRKYTEVLSKYSSEASLMRYRIVVEAEYLIALSDLKLLRKLSDKEKRLIRSLYDLRDKDAQIISDIEIKGYKNIKATDHDVKAVEYYLKDKFADTTLADISEWLHFALTSYDTNTVARGLMLRDALSEVILPKLTEINKSTNELAKKTATIPMLARTHGQPASPTTFGKELKVFSSRLQKQIELLKNQKVSVKFSGATGNYNAHLAAYPKINWIKFSQNFIEKFNKGHSLQIELNLITTQIDPHDREAEIFDNIKRINTILIGFNQDMWRYISDEWIMQKPAEGTVGSSTMPHKINPIKFENSEGNLGLANALFEFFARKLAISRLQRDLSDSTVERNFGVALSHCLIAYEYLLEGLSQIKINERKIGEDLRNHPEVVTEAIQTILRREGVDMPYEKLKELSRGKKITLADIHQFIDNLPVEDKVKRELKKITPENYIGLAAKIARL